MSRSAENPAFVNCPAIFENKSTDSSQPPESPSPVTFTFWSKEFATVTCPHLKQSHCNAILDTSESNPICSWLPATNETKVDPSLTENDPSLTENELQLLQLISQGLENRDIGKQLGYEEKTIKNNLTQLYRKFKVTDRVEAVIKAVKLGCIDTSFFQNDDIQRVNYLTKRELELLNTIIGNKGKIKSDTDIARKMIISESNVSRRLTAIMEKLMVKTRVQAALLYYLAVQKGIVENQSL